MPTIYKSRKATGREKGITFRLDPEVHERLEELSHTLRKPKLHVVESLINDATKDFPQFKSSESNPQ